MRISRSTLLDLATGGLVAVAAAVLVHDRILPALEERDRLDPGEPMDESIGFRSIGTGDTVQLTDDGGALLLVFRSTCPVCEETAPNWSRLAASAPHRVLPIGLEGDSAAAAWVADRLPGLDAAAPLDPPDFVDRLRIRAVPTTLLFERGRLVFSRIGPLQADDRARIERVLRDSGPDESVRTEFSR